MREHRVISPTARAAASVAPAAAVPAAVVTAAAATPCTPLLLRHTVLSHAVAGLTEHTREAMRAVLADVQSGHFAKKWIDESNAGETAFRARRDDEKQHQLEEVGARLRAMMPFVEAPSAVG